MNKEIKTKYSEEEAKHLFFTSDTHFGHFNIIRLCDRPFKSAEEMNETLINNWNNIVQPEDTVFHLGDFAIGGSQVWNTVLQQLNGHKILILGNHDMKNLRQGYMKYFDKVAFQMQIQIEERSIYLNHYPFLCYGGTYRSPEKAVWQLFGHVHSKPDSNGADYKRLKYCFPYQYDVGVDNNNYYPISWTKIKDVINEKVLCNNLECQ